MRTRFTLAEPLPLKSPAVRPASVVERRHAFFQEDGPVITWLAYVNLAHSYKGTVSEPKVPVEWHTLTIEEQRMGRRLSAALPKVLRIFPWYDTSRRLLAAVSIARNFNCCSDRPTAVATWSSIHFLLASDSATLIPKVPIFRV